MLGAAVGHYAASAVTKLVVNTVMVDPTRAAVNVSMTSPTTSLGHALFEGFSQFLPDLDHNTIWQAIQEAFDTPEVGEALQNYSNAVDQLDISVIQSSDNTPTAQFANTVPMPSTIVAQPSDPTLSFGNNVYGTATGDWHESWGDEHLKHAESKAL